MQLEQAMLIAGSGMSAQGQRLRVIAENIANADSVGRTDGAEPYRRQVLVFDNVLDRELGIERVIVSRRMQDKGELGKKYDPGHPFADQDGYIVQTNVNSILEMVDMKEARRGYEANLGIVEVTKAMVQRTLELLR